MKESPNTKGLAAASTIETPLIIDEEQAIKLATGEICAVPRAVREEVRAIIGEAQTAFRTLQTCPSAAIDSFLRNCATRLSEPQLQEVILSANSVDIEQTRARGRATSRVLLSQERIKGMIEGLELWLGMEPWCDKIVHRHEHQGWAIEQVVAPLGVVGFVFEGRPNVFADALGVIKGRNSVILRIGSDALQTARAIMTHVIRPALRDARLPEKLVQLVDTGGHAGSWAMVSDPLLSLAIVRGSGSATRILGAFARSAGVPVSLHGTGGAWLFVSRHAAELPLPLIIANSLDRKVCNTLNVCLIQETELATRVPEVLKGCQDAVVRDSRAGFRLHVTQEVAPFIPPDLYLRRVTIERHGQRAEEPVVDTISQGELAVEYEWDDIPELTLSSFSSLEQGLDLFEKLSPRFVASLISSSSEEQEFFFRQVEAPFVGNGFTRWVDGQYALLKPELGLSNWEQGRLLGRAAFLTGDAVATIKTRMYQTDPLVRR